MPQAGPRVPPALRVPHPHTPTLWLPPWVHFLPWRHRAGEHLQGASPSLQAGEGNPNLSSGSAPGRAGGGLWAPGLVLWGWRRHTSLRFCHRGSKKDGAGVHRPEGPPSRALLEAAAGREEGLYPHEKSTRRTKEREHQGDTATPARGSLRPSGNWPQRQRAATYMVKNSKQLLRKLNEVQHRKCRRPQASKAEEVHGTRPAVQGMLKSSASCNEGC